MALVNVDESAGREISGAEAATSGRRMFLRGQAERMLLLLGHFRLLTKRSTSSRSVWVTALNAKMRRRASASDVSSPRYREFPAMSP
eukprot:11397978-Alexandrium_andersonii.AAC.1